MHRTPQTAHWIFSVLQKLFLKKKKTLTFPVSVRTAKWNPCGDFPHRILLFKNNYCTIYRRQATRTTTTTTERQKKKNRNKIKVSARLHADRAVSFGFISKCNETIARRIYSFRAYLKLYFIFKSRMANRTPCCFSARNKFIIQYDFSQFNFYK